MPRLDKHFENDRRNNTKISCQFSLWLLRCDCLHNAFQLSVLGPDKKHTCPLFSNVKLFLNHQ